MKDYALYRAQIIWWWRHGREKNPRKSPIAQHWTIVTYGFGLENYDLKGIRYVRRKR